MCIRRWVVLYISIISGEDADTLDWNRPLSSFDIDSIDAVEMAIEFEKKFSVEVKPELFLVEDQTIQGLVLTLTAIYEVR